MLELLVSMPSPVLSVVCVGWSGGDSAAAAAAVGASAGAGGACGCGLGCGCRENGSSCNL